MPLVAVVVPIRRALTSTLRDALDISHKTMSDVKVTMQRLAEQGVSVTQTVLAAMLIAIGVTTFYLIPLAFLFRDFAFFLSILTAILIGMLVGLSMLAQMLQPALELLLLRVMLWITRDSARLYIVVSKSLAGHRSRNAKTSYLVSITIGFLVFASAMFGLQATSIVSNVRLFLGADVVGITLASMNAAGDATSGSGVVATLPQAAMSDFLRDLQQRADAPVLGYTFVSAPLTDAPYIQRSGLANLLNVPATRSLVYGVQQNMLDVAFSDFSIVTDATASGLPADASSVHAMDARAEYAPSRSWVLDYPVEALFSGAGKAQLPVEAGGIAAPLPLGTAPASAPVYVCAPLFRRTDPGDVWPIVPDALPALSNFSAAYTYVTSTCGVSGCAFARSALPVADVAYADYSYCMTACASEAYFKPANVSSPSCAASVDEVHARTGNASIGAGAMLLPRAPLEGSNVSRVV
ncbi:hypothetical protein EON62_04355, partial [archaeon]